MPRDRPWAKTGQIRNMSSVDRKACNVYALHPKNRVHVKTRTGQTLTPLTRA